MPTWRAPNRAASSRGRHAAPRASASGARVESGATLAGWAYLLGRPRPEPSRSRRLARLGGLVSILSLVIYVTWRVAFTMPTEGWDRVAAWTLVVFEAVPLVGLLIRIVTLWNIDSRGPDPVAEAASGTPRGGPDPDVQRAGRGDRADHRRGLRPRAGARDVGPRRRQPAVGRRDLRALRRPLRQPTDARARQGRQHEPCARADGRGAAAEGAEKIDVIAVLDCDHVPLPTFLTATLGWFDDPELALVQGPQSYYNSGAFDDDGVTGEQGMFFHVLLPARNHDGRRTRSGAARRP